MFLSPNKPQLEKAAMQEVLRLRDAGGKAQSKFALLALGETLPPDVVGWRSLSQREKLNKFSGSIQFHGLPSMMQNGSTLQPAALAAVRAVKPVCRSLVASDRVTISAPHPDTSEHFRAEFTATGQVYLHQVLPILPNGALCLPGWRACLTWKCLWQPSSGT